MHFMYIKIDTEIVRQKSNTTRAEHVRTFLNPNLTAGQWTRSQCVARCACLPHGPFILILWVWAPQIFWTGPTHVY